MLLGKKTKIERFSLFWSLSRFIISPTIINCHFLFYSWVLSKLHSTLHFAPLLNKYMYHVWFLPPLPKLWHYRVSLSLLPFICHSHKRLFALYNFGIFFTVIAIVIVILSLIWYNGNEIIRVQVIRRSLCHEYTALYFNVTCGQSIWVAWETSSIVLCRYLP